MTEEEYEEAKVKAEVLDRKDYLSKGAFFDVDGTLRHFGDSHPTKQFIITDILDVAWVDGAFQAMKLCSDNGYKIFWISNQEAIGEGLVTFEKIWELFKRMKRTAENFGARDINFDFCQHHPNTNCACKKPKPGLIYQFAVRYDLDLSNSFLVGDSGNDILAGDKAGIPLGRCILVRNPKEDGFPTTLEAVQSIIKRERNQKD